MFHRENMLYALENFSVDRDQKRVVFPDWPTLRPQMKEMTDSMVIMTRPPGLFGGGPIRMPEPGRSGDRGDIEKEFPLIIDRS